MIQEPLLLLLTVFLQVSPEMESALEALQKNRTPEVTPRLGREAARLIEGTNDAKRLEALVTIALKGRADVPLGGALVRVIAKSAGRSGVAGVAAKGLSKLDAQQRLKHLRSPPKGWTKSLEQLVRSEEPGVAKASAVLLAPTASAELIRRLLLTWIDEEQEDLAVGFLSQAAHFSRPVEVFRVLAGVNPNGDSAQEALARAVTELVRRDDVVANEALREARMGSSSAVMRSLGALRHRRHVEEATRILESRVDPEELEDERLLAAGLMSAGELLVADLVETAEDLAVRSEVPARIRRAAIWAFARLAYKDATTIDALIKLLKDPAVAGAAHEALVYKTGVKIRGQARDWLVWRQSATLPAEPPDDASERQEKARELRFQFADRNRKQRKPTANAPPSLTKVGPKDAGAWAEWWAEVEPIWSSYPDLVEEIEGNSGVGLQRTLEILALIERVQDPQTVEVVGYVLNRLVGPGMNKLDLRAAKRACEVLARYGHKSAARPLIALLEDRLPKAMEGTVVWALSVLARRQSGPPDARFWRSALFPKRRRSGGGGSGFDAAGMGLSAGFEAATAPVPKKAPAASAPAPHLERHEAEKSQRRQLLAGGFLLLLLVFGAMVAWGSRFEDTSSTVLIEMGRHADAEEARSVTSDEWAKGLEARTSKMKRVFALDGQPGASEESRQDSLLPKKQESAWTLKLKRISQGGALQMHMSGEGIDPSADQPSTPKRPDQPRASKRPVWAEPETGAGVDPKTAAPVDPKTAVWNDPDTDAEVDPGTAVWKGTAAAPEVDPKTAVWNDPDTDAEVDPGTAVWKGTAAAPEVDPKTAVWNDPDTDAEVDPSTAVWKGTAAAPEVDPKTAVWIDPDTDAEVDPSTAVWKGTAAAPEVDPKTAVWNDPDTDAGKSAERGGSKTALFRLLKKDEWGRSQ